jgi:hypothetical protein
MDLLTKEQLAAMPQEQLVEYAERLQNVAASYEFAMKQNQKLKRVLENVQFAVDAYNGLIRG